jgi:hypothetical protein
MVGTQWSHELLFNLQLLNGCDPEAVVHEFSGPWVWYNQLRKIRVHINPLLFPLTDEQGLEPVGVT